MDHHAGTEAAIIIYLLWAAFEKYTEFIERHSLAKRGEYEQARVMLYPFYFLGAGWSLFSGHTDLRERVHSDPLAPERQVPAGLLEPPP